MRGNKREIIEAMAEKACTACSGSGHYCSGKCGACNGTGLEYSRDEILDKYKEYVIELEEQLHKE